VVDEKKGKTELTLIPSRLAREKRKEASGEGRRPSEARAGGKKKAGAVRPVRRRRDVCLFRGG